MIAQTIHAAGRTPESPGTYAVGLAARDEAHLLKIEVDLTFRDIPHIAIREPDPPWNGQLMAIGIPPEAWRGAKRLLSTLPLMKEQS